MRTWLIGMAIAAAILPSSGAAQEAAAIVQARAAGSVGERFDGYLGLALAAPPGVRSQVAAINIKRRALYTNLGVRRGVSAQEVGIAAACTLLGRVGIGQAYLLADNRWRRRAPGEAAPRPDYCG
ncbi:MAG: YdbL family protein [Pseudomonadota bacterium]|nr:YdbL family protein [Pseudomonadota bacterium]